MIDEGGVRFGIPAGLQALISPSGAVRLVDTSITIYITKFTVGLEEIYNLRR